MDLLLKIKQTKITVRPGKTHIENAIPGETYQLIDSKTGKTPEYLKTSRNGQDLVLHNEQDNSEVIIKDFWKACTEDDQCFAVLDVPASEGIEAGQVIITQVDNELTAFTAGEVGTISENYDGLWWTLGGALGLGLLLGSLSLGGGNSSRLSDIDKDGKADSQEVTEAAQLVDQAATDKAAYEAAKRAAEEDGIVNEDELAELQAKKNTADQSHQAAQTAVEGIPEGTEGKAGLVERLATGDAAPTSDLPSVNDADKDGKADSQEVTEATQLVNQAATDKAAYEAAKRVAEEDGIVNEDELAELQAKKNTADQSHQAAQTAVEGIPEGTEGKAELVERLATGDASPTSNLPNVNDADKDGKADSQEVTEATQLVNQAATDKATYEAAKRVAEEDGIVNEDELAELQAKKNTADRSHQAAQTAVEGIPEGTEGKAGLVERLATGDAAPTSNLPNVTDADKDGKADNQEVTEATQLVDQAATDKAAYEAAKRAAEEDGIVNEEDLVTLRELKNTADRSHQAAQTAVEGIPEGTEGKAGLVERLTTGDASPTSNLPNVTDADKDGKADSQEVTEATQLVNQAATDKATYEAAKRAAEEDGVVNEDELAELQAKKNTADQSHQAAQTAVEGIPEGTEGKAGLVERLTTGDASSTSDLPIVNDANNNGVADSEEKNSSNVISEDGRKKVDTTEQVKNTSIEKMEIIFELNPNILIDGNSTAIGDLAKNGRVTGADVKSLSSEDRTITLTFIKNPSIDGNWVVTSGSGTENDIRTLLGINQLTDGGTIQDLQKLADPDGFAASDTAFEDILFSDNSQVKMIFKDSAGQQVGDTIILKDGTSQPESRSFDTDQNFGTTEYHLTDNNDNELIDTLAFSKNVYAESGNDKVTIISVEGGETTSHNTLDGGEGYDVLVVGDKTEFTPNTFVFSTSEVENGQSQLVNFEEINLAGNSDTVIVNSDIIDIGEIYIYGNTNNSVVLNAVDDIQWNKISEKLQLVSDGVEHHFIGYQSTANNQLTVWLDEQLPVQTII
ncbi:GA-like domain-containing protein [Gallibacterium genomosp. 3]|uniref:GA-like domain-containing protein n=1 Tax=Gallibacterium genomosp. 3 TaxID=505345 RepID=UPI00080281EF|nr:hypothetical protein [Gallibacterium genomosp. 3]